jgi:hypothetical protein
MRDVIYRHLLTLQYVDVVVRCGEVEGADALFDRVKGALLVDLGCGGILSSLFLGALSFTDVYDVLRIPDARYRM